MSKDPARTINYYVSVAISLFECSMWPSVTDVTSGPLMDYCPRPSYVKRKRHCPCMNSSSDTRRLGAGHTRYKRSNLGEMQSREWLGTYTAQLRFVQAIDTTGFQIPRGKEDG